MPGMSYFSTWTVLCNTLCRSRGGQLYGKYRVLLLLIDIKGHIVTILYFCLSLGHISHEGKK